MSNTCVAMSTNWCFSCRVELEETTERFESFTENSSVGSLLASISTRFELEAKDFWIVHKGKILADTKKELIDYRVDGGDTVILHRRRKASSETTTTTETSHVFPASEIITLRTPIEAPPSPPAAEDAHAAVPIPESTDAIDLDESVCAKCRGRNLPNDAENVLCEDCHSWTHWACVGLRSLPHEDWYCDGCKNDFNIVVRPDNEEHFVKGNKRTKVDLPKNHRGHIPGIHVGQSWLLRMSCSRGGMHRPPCAGIAGSQRRGGAVSIVLNGGYSTDEDHGSWFHYTGAGGLKKKDHQIFTKDNLAVAATCDAELNQDGATARDWRMSKAVRVIRGYKSGLYAPAEGYRYDGLYKVVRYWRTEPLSNGYTRYMFEFRRDDNTPLPWTQAGKQMVRELGLKMVMPDSKVSATDTLQPEEPEPAQESATSLLGNLNNETALCDSTILTTWQIPEPIHTAITEAISANPLHERLFAPVLQQDFDSKNELIRWLHENMACPICKDIVNEPVTPPCGHVVCLRCIRLSCKSDFGCKCPLCSASLLTSTLSNGDGDSAREGKLARTTFLGLVEVDKILVKVLQSCLVYPQEIKSTVLKSRDQTFTHTAGVRRKPSLSGSQSEVDEQIFDGMRKSGAETVGAARPMGFREKKALHFNHHGKPTNGRTTMSSALHHMSPFSESAPPANVQDMKTLKRGRQEDHRNRTVSFDLEDNESHEMARDRRRPRKKSARGLIMDSSLLLFKSLDQHG